MKYLIFFVLVFFFGCGSDDSLDLNSDANVSTTSDANSSFNEEGEVFQEFVYDKNSTKEKIILLTVRLFITQPNYTTWEGKEISEEISIISSKDALDEIINETLNKFHEPEEIAQLRSYNIDFEENNIIVVFHVFSYKANEQTIIRLDERGNANIELKMVTIGDETVSYGFSSFTRVFLVSKDILTINGHDIF